MSSSCKSVVEANLSVYSCYLSIVSLSVFLVIACS